MFKLPLGVAKGRRGRFHAAFKHPGHHGKPWWLDCFINRATTTTPMNILEFGQKLRPDAERLHINVDKRYEIILIAYNLSCDDLFRGGGQEGLAADIDLIGHCIFSNCGRIKKEGEYFRCVLVLIFQERLRCDLKIAKSIADQGFGKYEQILKEQIPMNANDSEYEFLIKEAADLGVERSRAESIIWVARESLIRFFNYGEHKDLEKIGFHIDKIAMPFTDVCMTPAECRFCCKAVSYLIYEDHGRERQHAEDISGFMAQRAVQLFDAKKSQSGKGCLFFFVFIGIFPLGGFAVRHFLV